MLCFQCKYINQKWIQKPQLSLNIFRVRYWIVDTQNQTKDTKFLTRPQTYLANSTAKFQRPIFSRSCQESRASCLNSKCIHKSTCTKQTQIASNGLNSFYLRFQAISPLPTWSTYFKPTTNVKPASNHLQLPPFFYMSEWKPKSIKRTIV